MDVFTRMIRGWQVSQHLTQPLTLKPLQQALRRSVPEIHHSDQGVQYLSSAYLSTLRQQGIEISVARRGCPWENGYAERLVRTLKEEEVHLNDYEDITEARERIGHFITQVYHQKRPHSALGYLTPMEFQTKKLGLTLLIFGLNKRWHFIDLDADLNKKVKDLIGIAKDKTKPLQLARHKFISHKDLGVVDSKISVHEPGFTIHDIGDVLDSVGDILRYIYNYYVEDNTYISFNPGYKPLHKVKY